MENTIVPMFTEERACKTGKVYCVCFEHASLDCCLDCPDKDLCTTLENFCIDWCEIIQFREKEYSGKGE